MAKDITIEAREFLPRIQEDINQRFFMASFFLVLMLILRTTFKISLPDIVFLLVSFLVLSSPLIGFLVNRVQTKNPQTAVNYYFGYLLLDLFLITLIINFVGGITWIAPSLYLFYIITLFWLFPKFQAIFLVCWINFLFVLLVFGNYFGILPYFQVFSPEEGDPQNLPFVVTLTIVALAIIGFLGYSSDTFYRLLDKKIRELTGKRKELFQTKRFLEVEIEKRTKELQKERERIARETEERTRELEERRKAAEIKVKELEKSHQIAVARELKMTEIKENIANLKKLKLRK